MDKQGIGRTVRDDTVDEHKFIIVLENSTVIYDVQKLNNKNQIKENTKLYYELGHKKNSRGGNDEDNWIRSGKFKEIKNPIEMRDEDTNMDNIEYIKHHNFFIC